MESKIVANIENLAHRYAKERQAFLQILAGRRIECAIALSDLCQQFEGLDFVRDMEAVIQSDFSSILACLPEAKRQEIETYLQSTTGEPVSLVLGIQQLAVVRQIVDRMKNRENEAALMNELQTTLAETNSDAIKRVATKTSNSECLLMLRALPLSRSRVILDAVASIRPGILATLSEGYVNIDADMVAQLKKKLIVAESETWKIQTEERETLLKLVSTTTLENEEEVLSLVGTKPDTIEAQMRKKYFRSQIEFLPFEFLSKCLRQCDRRKKELFLGTMPRKVREQYLVQAAKKAQGRVSKRVIRLDEADFPFVHSRIEDEQEAVESVMQVVRREISQNKSICRVAADRMISSSCSVIDS